MDTEESHIYLHIDIHQDIYKYKFGYVLVRVKIRRTFEMHSEEPSDA